MRSEAHEAALTAGIDQLRAMAAEKWPDKSYEWQDTWLKRLIHYELYSGDMTGAPDLPDDA